METKTFLSNEIDSLFCDQAILKVAIEKIEKQLFSEGKVLCEIRINGMALTPDDEMNFENSRRDEIKTLEVRAQLVTVLVSDSRASVINYLNQLKDVALKAAEALRAGVSRDGSDMISAVVNGTQWVTEMLNQIRTLEGNFWKFEKQWLAAEDNFLKTTRELLGAYEKGDLILVADNLEYEWSSSIDQWLNVLSLLDPAS
jgi:hypothetical protein